jgi:predicted nuclease with TOPRIM domain
LQGSDPSLAELISIFLLRILLGGEYKLSVKSILLIHF